MKKPTDTLFLPNFCDVYTIFLGVLVTELLAFILILTPISQTGYHWNYINKNILIDLGSVSLFVQWITLSSMGLFCLLRRYLSQVENDVIVGFISYILILLVTLIISEFAWRLTVAISWPDSIHHGLFLGRNMGISAILSAIALRYFYIQYHWKKEIEANANARAQALQARIRPHFLFNCMNTIASLIRFQPKNAEQVVEDLADLFRASLADTKICVTFKEEIALCRQYVHIETIRIGERLQVVWHIDNIPDDALLPQLCLQPLLENAVYHGIQPLAEGGIIAITGQFDGQNIQVNIENPLADILSPHQGNQMAQENIGQRLQFLYGSQGKLNVQRYANTYHVKLIFPYKK
ncbi:MAG: histidine kinase [Thiotrichaceae bacterium]|nr:histidine kinase [Thiotrichaceae bacterium]